MSVSNLNKVFKALGDPTRLEIYECLRSCDCELTLDEDGGVMPGEGTTVGEVCCYVAGSENEKSRISFHLKELRNADLIDMEKVGRHTVCRINRETLSKVQAFFNGESEHVEE